MNLPIILIGLLGAGKSKVAQALSAKLAISLHDTDQLIEDQAQQSIASIFAAHGEERFRALEHELLVDLLEIKKIIISTGGGIILSDENRRLMKEKGVCIFLDVDIETLCDRLKNDHTRPLLQGGNLKQRLTTLKEQRQNFYKECAQITIDVNNKEVAAIADEIIEHLNKLGYTEQMVDIKPL